MVLDYGFMCVCMFKLCCLLHDPVVLIVASFFLCRKETKSSVTENCD